MVRLLRASSSASAPSLYLCTLNSATEPLVQLRVDKAEFWTFENVTVVRTPDGSLVGAPFPNVSHAMGQLKRFLPAGAQPHEYVELLHAYVVGPLDEALLGARHFHFQLHGQKVSARHSPGLATALVECLPGLPAQEHSSGRWLPLAVLRPFVPETMNDEDAAARVKELMRHNSHVPFVRPQLRLPKRKLPTGDESDAVPDASHEREPTSTRDDPSLECTGSASSTASSSAAVGRTREKWFDKTGNVVVLKPQGAAALLPWPTCLAIVGKRHGPPKGSGKSPRYVVTTALPPAASTATDEWHISEVEPLCEALPRAYAAYAGGRAMAEGERQRLLAAIVHATMKQSERRQHLDGPCNIGPTWDSLVPEAVGRWAELEAALDAQSLEEGELRQ